MHATNQQSFSDSSVQQSETEHPKVINVVENLRKVMSISAQSSNERETELEHVAVLAYD